MLNSTKGSVFRKWDFHIHTPESHLNNQFTGDWDQYVKDLFTKAIEKDISAIGITDYFTIDGYKILRKEYLDNPAKLESLFSPEEIEKILGILVFPNIEFRLNKFVGENSINFHVLFAEDVPIEFIEENFLHDIDFVYEGNPQNADEKSKLKVTNLITLGQKLREEHQKFKHLPDIYVGMMNAVVDDDQISKVLNCASSKFKGKYLIGVVSDEDLSDIDWNSKDHQTRKVLIQKSDFLLSSNPKTRQWALGMPPYTEGSDKFVQEFKTLKPCLHGSDAHEAKFIGHPCAKRGEKEHNCSDTPEDCELRFCWIKADLTFEGLKQVLYEPADRVAIQPNDPTPLKSSQTITEFNIEPVGLGPELQFHDAVIPLNNGLVAVTGGKGGGKTAFVDLISNMYQDRAFCSDKNSFAKRITENSNPKDIHTKITLLNDLNLRKEVKERSFVEGASLVYVAQGELEQHVEDPAHLEHYINNLIFESNEIRDSELLFDYQNINEEVDDLNELISTSNSQIFSLEIKTDIKITSQFNKDIKKLEIELKDVEKKVKELSKGLSPEKVEAAEKKQKQLTELREKKASLNELGMTIKEAVKFVDNNLAGFNKIIDQVNTLTQKLEFDREFKKLNYPDAADLRTFIVTVREKLRGTIGEIEKFQKELEENERGVKEHAKLLDKKKELEKAIIQLKQKLATIEQQKENLASKVDSRNKLFSDLVNKRIEQRNKYLAIITAFSANKNEILNDLEFVAELVFDRNRFIETMAELVDQRKIKIRGVNNSDSDIAFFVNAVDKLTTDPSEGNVKDLAEKQVLKLLEKIIPNQRKTETFNRQTMYDSVFADYFNVIPSVKYKRVSLSKLSLGQKATVLIKIYLAQGESPIIIDSHDDHLDNEFIMDELVKALRQAKQYRQVIIVSNNGNVVVNSDAEQVVIASRNEEGEISYTSGSLENPNLRTKLLSVLEGGEEAFSKRQKKYRLQF